MVSWKFCAAVAAVHAGVAGVAALEVPIKLQGLGEGVLHVDQSRSVEDTVREFVIVQGWTDLSNFDWYIRSVVSQVAVGAGLQPDPVVARVDGGAVPENFRMGVEVAKGTVVDLVVFDGESARDAAEGFVARQGLSDSDVDRLVAAINRKAHGNSGAPYLMFSVPIEMDGRSIGALKFFSDQIGREKEVVESYFREVGLHGNADFNDIVSAITAEVTQRLNRMGSEVALALAHSEDRVHEALSQARAKEASMFEFPSAETDVQTVSLLIAGTAFDLEFSKSDDATKIASQFCAAEWDLLAPVLQQELAVTGGKVSQGDCSVVLSELITAKVQGK